VTSASGRGRIASTPTGHLKLRAERLGGRTVLVAVERSAPFGLGAPSYRAGEGRAEVVVQDVGPGRFPGDELLVEIAVGAGADLTVRGQAATKLYPSPEGRPARSRTRLSVEAGGRLVYLPGELIPFRDAVYEGETTVEVAAGGGCALLEVLAPGRAAMGEQLAYRRLDLRLRARLGERLVLTERNLLEPGARSLSGPAGHGAFACAGSLTLIGGEAIAGAVLTAGNDPVWVGVGGRGGVTIGRVLGPTAQGVRVALEGAMARSRRSPAESGPMGERA
jgi:urease accessory protein